MASEVEVIDLTLTDSGSDVEWEDTRFEDSDLESLSDGEPEIGSPASSGLDVKPQLDRIEVLSTSDLSTDENEEQEGDQSDVESGLDVKPNISRQSKEGCYYNEDRTLPVFKWTSSKYHFSIEELGKILLTGSVLPGKICSRQPTGVCHNAAFLVDLKALDDCNDIRADENGVWKRNGAPIAFISLHDGSRVIRRTKMKTHSHYYKLSRTYYIHSSSPDFHRIITFANDCNGETQQYAFVQYSFDRFEHQIDVKPHGNSKGKQPFSRTKPSVIKRLKASSSTKAPRKVLREIENSQGGVMGARSACDLPRNKKQVKNFKYSEVQSTGCLSGDVLAHVMQVCKSSDTFIRSVEAAPEPMCILATDQQLVDIERFCTGNPSCVLSIDPTFNLGPFYVTPTTYQNLLVETTRGNNPILLGPILIHQTKTFRPFHYLASTLIRLNCQMQHLRAFGTDGEPELIRAFNISFPTAVHLRCTNHLRQNIKDKLRAIGLSQDVCKEFLADIFGARTGTHFEAGLADAVSEAAFSKALDRLKARWNNLEKSCFPADKEAQFYSWFCRYKRKEFVENVLPEVRRQAGYKNPESFFTTNCSESLNHVIKQEVEWKESKLPQLIDKLKFIVDDNCAELEKAVIGHGSWHFTLQYESLAVSKSHWFSGLTDSAKRSHMKKVFNQKPFFLEPPQRDITNTAHSVLGISIEDSGIVGVSESTLRNIWTKAEKLVADGHITKVPWSEEGRFVKSHSSDQPHLVTKSQKNKGIYQCDKNCPMFKGFSLCSHLIAAARFDGNLRSFLDEVKGACVPNLTAIATHGMPTGTGKKGGVARRKRKRPSAIESRSVRPCLESEGDLSPSSTAKLLTSSASSTNIASATLQPNTTSANSGQSSSGCNLPLSLSTGSTVMGPSNQPHVVGPQVGNMTIQPHSSSTTTTTTTVRPRVTNLNTSCGQGLLHNLLVQPVYSPSQNPFIVKFKTNQIKICQSCRKNYDGGNDTMGLVVARAERRLVSNLATGKQFLGRESNSCI